MRIRNICAWWTAVVRGRHEHAFEGAEAADETRVDPELVDQVDGIDREQHFQREADREQWQVEYPAKQEASAGLPQGRGQVVLLALVVHGMRSPEN